MDQTKLNSLVARVAEAAMRYRYYHYDWGEAIAMEGLWRASQLTGEQRFADCVRRMIDGWLAHSPTPWFPDHVGPGRILLERWRETNDPRFLDYARQLAEHLANLPRTATGAYLHRPDLPDRAQLVWVDSMQTDAPFMARLAVASSESRWFDAAAEHIAGHIGVLQDEPTGLFHHHYHAGTGRTNGVFWGRGNGWAILGLVHTLDVLPPQHAHHFVIRRSLEKLAAAIAERQDKTSGLWHTVLDHPETYCETSASLMFAEAFLRAGQRGLLPQAFTTMGQAVFQTLAERVAPDGVVQGVSSRTPPSGEVTHYNQISCGGNYPWGQGPYLLAAATSREIGER